MAHGENAKRHGRVELWSARPLAGYEKNSSNKKCCRRMERAQRRNQLRNLLHGKEKAENLV